MTSARTFTAWGLGVSAVLLSPVIVIFLIPLMIGIGLDVFELTGEVPFALALCAPGAFVLLRLVSPRTLFVALMHRQLPLHRPAKLTYAPKSIS